MMLATRNLTPPEHSIMAQKTPTDFNAFFDFQKRAMAPFAEFNEWAVKTAERAARHQYEVAGETLEFALAQARAVVGSKDPQALAAKQAQLATEFFGKQTARSNEWMKLATSTQSEIGKWMETANEEIVSAVRKRA
jgi:hypothetical protein